MGDYPHCYLCSEQFKPEDPMNPFASVIDGKFYPPGSQPASEDDRDNQFAMSGFRQIEKVWLCEECADAYENQGRAETVQDFKTARYRQWDAEVCRNRMTELEEVVATLRPMMARLDEKLDLAERGAGEFYPPDEALLMHSIGLAADKLEKLSSVICSTARTCARGYKTSGEERVALEQVAEYLHGARGADILKAFDM